MAWSMPHAGQWNPAIPVATDLNMGTYTPEQWAVVQQQNWQQWAQWQQQYAQWQSQYGEKYAEQMQAMQCIGVAPPLPPPNAPPPAPPLPDKPPPPPPPHENNQPLYVQTSARPAPVPAPTIQHNNTGYTNASVTGNNQNWSYAAEQCADSSQHSVNANALKKLAEEERLFDIQFQKWEEEIEKWKRENVNHPDKQAYKEYEEKFETCRLQLLERRQQMNLKRAKLLGNTQPPSTTKNITGNNAIATTVSAGFQNISIKNQNKPPQNKPHSNQDQSNYQHYNDVATNFIRGNNKNIDPQDRYESYQEIENYTDSDSKSSFIPSSGPSKGIPGLDLVPEPAPSKKPEVIDITEDRTVKHVKAPDYSTISKGINSILGDEKIMNILSMVRDQTVGPSQNTNIAGGSYSDNTVRGNMLPNLHMPPPSRDTIPPYGNNMPPHRNNIQPHSNSMQPRGNNMSSQINLSSHGNNMHHNNYNIPQNNYNLAQNNHNMQQTHQAEGNEWDRNDNNYNQQMGNRQPVQFNRQGPYPVQDQNESVQKRMYGDRQGDTNHGRQYYDPNTSYGKQNIQDGPEQQIQMRPNMQQRPTVQDMSGQPHANDYPKNHPHNHGVLESEMPINQPARPKWKGDPLFAPSIIVEYEHKPLRLKARDFIEPVHIFEYNHISKEEDCKKKDFEKEGDDLFMWKSRRPDDGVDRIGYEKDKYSRDTHTREFERRAPHEDVRDDYRLRDLPRHEYDDRRRLDNRYDKRRDDRDKYARREDVYKERERDRYRDARRSRSRERDLRKRARSRDSDFSDHSKKSKESVAKPPGAPKHIIMIDDILDMPGRTMRPEKIVIILRGLPGSGKSYLAKLIRDREAEYGGAARIMSIDDYFMQEGEEEEKDPSTGKIIKKPTMKYEYDEKSEETYLNSLKRALKRSITDGYFSFIIFDAVNDQLKSYADVWNYARQYQFQVYVCTLELDVQTCFKRNIHNRTLEDIEVINSRFFPTPVHHITLDPTTLLQSAAIPEVQMEDVSDEVIMDDVQETDEVENVFTSKWEKMDDAVQLARLDGISKPLRPSQISMEDYLQLDEWTPNIAKPGKKTVRWADIEERRQQEKMRAIGFVVGQTDWNRMTDPTMGSSALTQTKYIERVRRN